MINIMGICPYGQYDHIDHIDHIDHMDNMGIWSKNQLF